VTLAEITNETCLPVKTRTTGNYLHAMNRWTFLARRKPYSHQKSRKARKKWYREQSKWELKRWRKHCFTDEVQSQVGAGTEWRRKVRQTPGRDSAYQLQNLQPTFIGEPFGVWFGAAFTYGYHT
jgi:hypothetical protein